MKQKHDEIQDGQTYLQPWLESEADGGATIDDSVALTVDDHRPHFIPCEVDAQTPTIDGSGWQQRLARRQ